MKLTVMIAIGMLSFLSPAQAEDWQFVTDGPDGGRVLIDSGSIVKFDNACEAKKKCTGNAAEPYIQAQIRVVGAANTEADWKAMVAIDYNSCMKSKNGMMLFLPGGAKKADTFFWDATANRIYDNVGGYMCGFQWGIEHPGEKLPGADDATPAPEPQSELKEKSL